MPHPEHSIIIPSTMSIWGRNALPELERFEGKAAQRAAFKKAYWKAWKSGRNWLKVILISAFAQVTAMFFYRALLRSFGLGEHANLIRQICIGAAGGLTGLFLWIVARKSMIKNLRIMLNAEGQPTCMSCGYYLRVQVETAPGSSLIAGDSIRCPECGTKFEVPIEFQFAPLVIKPRPVTAGTTPPPPTANPENQI